MPTTFQHRIILIVPAAKVAAVVSWFQTNIGAASVPADLGPGLSATGTAPATFAWMCGAYTDPECRAILNRLCTLASVATPSLATWNGWSGAEKRSWLASVRAAILAGYGTYVMLADNAGQWDDPTAGLAAMGLQRIAAAGG